MAQDRRFELDDLLIRPGTYFNPQTEVMVVVDDSPAIDAEVFNLEAFEGADWVLIADDLPIDEPRRDEFFERFQVTYQAGESRSAPADEDLELDEEGDDDDTLEPDPELDEEVGAEPEEDLEEV